jgi:imidazolonepropionase-like amidohydrolase
MRMLRTRLSLATACALALAPLTRAQEPTPPATPPTPAPAEAPREAPADTPPSAENRPRRPRRVTTVIEAGTVHPVAGPAIANGVVVLRGERIVAVGKKGDIEVPADAQVRAFPTGHVYPGLIDAATDAYTDPSLRGDGSLDAASAFVDDLRLRATRDDELVQAGITTAYVTVRAPALLRGQGAVVRPTKAGFEPWPGKERAAVQMRLAAGPQPSHALQRQQQQRQADAVFEGLDEFRKGKKDHDEARAKYEKEFADYLAWHQKKKDAEKPADGKPADGKPAEPAATPPAGSTPAPARTGGDGEPPRRRRGGGGGGEAADDAAQLEQALATLFEALAQDPPKQDPPKQDPPKPEKQEPGAQGAASKEGGDKPAGEAPKRPTWPKPPAKDPAKDALLAVLDGALPLRVEAHRPDDLRAALRMQRERNIPQLVLETAFGAGGLAAEIAGQAASVVLTDVLPGRQPRAYEAFDATRLPSLLQAAGVPFAIATGNARHAGLLPLMAATAVGNGLDRDAALRAITLTPAEILGVAKDTGSLQPGKFADLLVTDKPLLASDSRVLLVLAKGRPEFEAQ